MIYWVKIQKFEIMFIDVDKIPVGKDVITSVPELFDIPSWKKYKGRFDRNKLARYILIIYNKDHQLNKSRIPFPERKKKALALAGFSNRDGVFDEQVTEFIYWLKSPDVVEMAHDYLRLQGEPFWTEIILIEHELDESNKIRLTPIDHFSKDIQGFAKGAKSKLREESMGMVKSLDELYKKFYGDATDVKDAYRKKMTTMESRAKELTDV